MYESHCLKKKQEHLQARFKRFLRAQKLSKPMNIKIYYEVYKILADY
jgi:hypothetical protein